MSHARLRVGALGEWLAAMMLRLSGYRIVDRNVRLAAGEIDIVARRGRRVAFVEVKTRRGEGRWSAASKVDRRKQLRIFHLARAYLRRHPFPGCHLHFDVITVTLDGWRSRGEHLRDAFQVRARAGFPWQPE